MDIIGHLKQEWGVVKNAPLSCVILLLLGGAAASAYYSDRVTAAHEVVALYEAKLKVSSPDEAVELLRKAQEDTNAQIREIQAQLKQRLQEGIVNKEEMSYQEFSNMYDKILEETFSSQRAGRSRVTRWPYID